MGPKTPKIEILRDYALILRHVKGIFDTQLWLMELDPKFSKISNSHHPPFRESFDKIPDISRVFYALKMINHSDLILSREVLMNRTNIWISKISPWMTLSSVCLSQAHSAQSATSVTANLGAVNEFQPQPGPITFVEIDCETISTAILSLPLISIEMELFSFPRARLKNWSSRSHHWRKR